MIESCRQCRDELPFGAPSVPADFILWGKLLPSDALGPKCYEHAKEWLGPRAMGQLDQYAVFDLRPLHGAGELVVAAKEQNLDRADRVVEDIRQNKALRSASDLLGCCYRIIKQAYFNEVFECSGSR